MPASRRSQTVLCTSLDPILRETRKRLIEEAVPGSKVFTAGNTAQAERICREQALRLAIIGYTLPTAEKLLIFATLKGTQPKATILELFLTSPPVTGAGGTLDISGGPEAFVDCVKKLLKVR
jgi:hypothetical protein